MIADLLTLLQSLGTHPKKGLSQNFLIDANIVKKIVETADVQPGDIVLEIGPGAGALTKALLDAGATVHAIEKDRMLADALHRHERLHVYAADALEFPLETIPFQKVVANLPYHITTPLLEKFFERPFTSLTLMVQEEFAVRLLANEGSKDFGSLSVFTRFFTQIADSFAVSEHCFYPKPSVTSRVVHLKSQKAPDVPAAPFFQLVRTAFQQRRKMLSTSLQRLLSKETTKNTLQAIGLREDARPEMLSFENWVLFLKKALPCMVQKDEPCCTNYKAALSS